MYSTLTLLQKTPGWHPLPFLSSIEHQFQKQDTALREQFRWDPGGGYLQVRTRAGPQHAWFQTQDSGCSSPPTSDPSSQGTLRSQVLPGSSQVSLPHSRHCCTHWRKKSPGKFCLKHTGGRQHCLTGCNVFALEGFIVDIFRHYDARYNLPQAGHMPSTLCLNDLENIFT